jgi:lipopolysaccharide transport system permease protein
LLVLLVKRDFVTVYKQTILGPLWFFIQPLFMTLMFTVVFGKMAKITTDGLPPILFYLAGITLWNFFADCITKTSTTFKDNQHIFGKVYFPRVISPLSVVVSNAFKLTIQLLLFLAFYVYYYMQGAAIAPSWQLVLVPILFLNVSLLGLGLGLIITSMTTKYRDLAFLIEFGVRLMMYATPVIYPLSSIPEKYQFYLSLNPMTSIIETFKVAFLGQGTFSWSNLLYSLSVTAILLILGVFIFNKTEQNFMDTV